MQRLCPHWVRGRQAAVAALPPKGSDLYLNYIVGPAMRDDGQQMTTQRRDNRADQRLAPLRVEIAVEIPGAARAEIAADRRARAQPQHHPTVPWIGRDPRQQGNGTGPQPLALVKSPRIAKRLDN